MRHAEMRSSTEDLMKAERNLWLTWVIVTTVSAGVGWALAAAVMDTISKTWVIEPAQVALYGLIAATVIGCGQWLVLRRQVSHSLGWLILTPTNGAIGSFAGWYVVFTLTISLFSLPWVGAVINGATFGLVGGLVVGMVQYGILAKAGHRNHRWIWATALGGALGIGLGFPIFDPSAVLSLVTPEWMKILSAGGGGIVAGAIGGAVTGFELLTMLRQARARAGGGATPVSASLVARSR